MMKYLNISETSIENLPRCDNLRKTAKILRQAKSRDSIDVEFRFKITTRKTIFSLKVCLSSIFLLLNYTDCNVVGTDRNYTSIQNVRL